MVMPQEFNLPKQKGQLLSDGDGISDARVLASVSSPESRKVSQTTVLLSLYNPDGQSLT